MPTRTYVPRFLVCRKNESAFNGFDGLDLSEVDPKSFQSIDFRDKSLTPTPSQEVIVPREASTQSFMDRILRGGSGLLAIESLVRVSAAPNFAIF